MLAQGGTSLVSKFLNIPLGKAAIYGIGAVVGASILRRLVSYGIRHSLKGKVVLITGCDSGFGQRLALQLNQRGATVLASCLTEAGMQHHRDQATSAAHMHPFIMDVTSDESVDRAFSGIVSTVSPNGLWAVVNNAGIFHGGPLPMTPHSELRRQLEINVEGVARIDRAALPLLMKQRRAISALPFGRILIPCRSRVITIASVAGEVALPASAFYCASKFAALALAEAFRRECQSFGIGGSIICPGFTRTNLFNEYLADDFLDRRLATTSPDVIAWFGMDFIKKMYKHSMLLMTMMGAPSAVVDTLEEAVAAKWPCARYHVGLDAHLIFRPMSMLPIWAEDMVSAVVFGLPVPAAAK